MKSGEFKGPPKKRRFRDVVQTLILQCNTLKIILEKINNNSYQSFENIFLNALNIYVPLKTKMLRFNNTAFITRKLRKGMKRSKLKNNFNKNGNHEH